jgi:hypothetical protein
MISNMFLLAFGLHNKIMNNELFLNSISDKTYDWDDIAKTKKKLVAMRFKRNSEDDRPAPLDLEAVRARVHSDKPKRDGLSLRDRHKSAMKHWFKSDAVSDEGVIAQRLSTPPASRLPSIEPLPSSEDSYLAFTCDDEVFFDAPVLERWKEFVDEKTAIVRVARSEEPSYSQTIETSFGEGPRAQVQQAHYWQQ